MSNYFSKIPNFDYVSRLPNAKISDYIRVKNFFKRAKLREDIFQNLAFFERYVIEGDDRPDNVAFKVYNDSTLDWVVLLSNNIINVKSEWPLPQRDFDEFVLEKYGDYNTLYNKVHHFESKEEKNSFGVVIVPAGLEVQENYTITYYDPISEKTVVSQNLSVPITNYTYEERLNNTKRLIYILKPFYLNLVINDIESVLPYKEGSSQYVSEDLVKGDNIRLYY